MDHVDYQPSFFLLIALIYLPNLALIGAQNSTCSSNGSSICSVLPFNASNPPDVWLNVPNLSVDEISLVVEDLQAHISLAANVATLVSINAGVDVSIAKVNLTITGVKAQVQLAVRLDNIAKIINRTMASLDLNPLLTSVINGVFDTVNNLLGTLTQNGQLIHQIINNAGQIVNQVLGTAGQVLSSTVVGDYLQNMTFTGLTQNLANGQILKQYSYPAPSGSSSTGNSLVSVIFDTVGNVIQALVASPSAALSTAAPTAVTTVSPSVEE